MLSTKTINNNTSSFLIMEIIADLHLHGRYSRGTSKNLNIDNMEKYSRQKGTNLLGTGDFTHPEWIQELKTKLTTEEDGIYKTKTGFSFMLTTEISLIYTQDKKGRKVHNVVLAPNFEVVDQITDWLLTKGRVDYDGRPIFGMNCVEFVEGLRNISTDIEVIPAHIWTPWFSLFGSNSGFDTVKEAFGDQTKHINALETGLSSDPAMNWRLSQLDKYLLVSFSDAHSYWPWRMGREATVFDTKLSYKDIINAIRNKTHVTHTIEVDPSYGKYHLDGHRACDICMEPVKSLKIKNICPKCKKPLTIGVLHRVEELADRPEGYIPRKHIPFKSLIPLSEILATMLRTSIATKKVWAEFYKLITKDRSELDILLTTPKEELEKLTDPKIAEAIIKVRKGHIKMRPGYDGVYGVPLLGSMKEPKRPEVAIKEEQKGMSDFL